MSLPFKWTKSWIVSDYSTNRLVVPLGYDTFVLFCIQTSGVPKAITVKEYSWKGEISTNDIIVDNNVQTNIFNSNTIKGTHLVILAASNVASPGFTFYGYGKN